MLSGQDSTGDDDPASAVPAPWSAAQRSRGQRRIATTVTWGAVGLALVGVLVLLLSNRSHEQLRERPLSYWAAVLRSADPRSRLEAAEVIASGAGQSDAAADLLLDALEDDRVGPVHDMLARGLTNLGPRSAVAVPRLIAQTRDEHSDVRRAAVTALAHLAVVAPATIGALTSARADSNHDVRISALDGLMTLGPKARLAAPALARAIDDPISYVRLGAIEALDRVGASSDIAIPAFTRALSSADDQMRAHAAAALGRRGPDAGPSTSALARLVRVDPDAEVRRSAVGALGAIGVPAHGALPELLRARTDPDSSVRAAAYGALKRLRS